MIANSDKALHKADVFLALLEPHTYVSFWTQKAFFCTIVVVRHETGRRLEAVFWPKPIITLAHW